MVCITTSGYTRLKTSRMEGKASDVYMVVLNAGNKARYLLGLSAEYGDG